MVKLCLYYPDRVMSPNRSFAHYCGSSIAIHFNVGKTDLDLPILHRNFGKPLTNGFLFHRIVTGRCSTIVQQSSMIFGNYAKHDSATKKLRKSVAFLAPSTREVLVKCEAPIGEFRPVRPSVAVERKPNMSERKRWNILCFLFARICMNFTVKTWLAISVMTVVDSNVQGRQHEFPSVCGHLDNFLLVSQCF